MDPLVTLSHVKDHLRIRHDEEDDDLALKMEQATAIVLDYLKDRADDDWTIETVPGQVQAAILIQVAELRRDRGDDDPERTMNDALVRVPDGYLSPRVTRLLHRFRDPTLA